MENSTRHSVTQPQQTKRNRRFLRFKLQPGDEAFFDGLTEGQRALMLTEGSYQERAQKLGIPMGTVRSRLHRARAAIERLRPESRNFSRTDETAAAH